MRTFTRLVLFVGAFGLATVAWSFLSVYLRLQSFTRQVKETRSGDELQCLALSKDYNVVPGVNWGRAPSTVQLIWKQLACDYLLSGKETDELAAFLSGESGSKLTPHQMLERRLRTYANPQALTPGALQQRQVAMDTKAATKAAQAAKAVALSDDKLVEFKQQTETRKRHDVPPPKNLPRLKHHCDLSGSVRTRASSSHPLREFRGSFRPRGAARAAQQAHGSPLLVLGIRDSKAREAVLSSDETGLPLPPVEVSVAVDFVAPLRSQAEEAEALMQLLDQPVHQCCLMSPVGGRFDGDGVWTICFDHMVDLIEVPSAMRDLDVLKSRSRAPCVIYSVGIAHDFSFDDQMASLGCQVHCFDPSMGVTSHKRSDAVKFYDVGLGGRDDSEFTGTEMVSGQKQKWRVRTLPSLMKDLGHATQAITLLKMDIEFGEWQVLAALLETPGFLRKRVAQIAFEIHMWPRGQKTDYGHTAKELREWFALLSRLTAQEGFVMFYSHRNPMSTNQFLHEAGRRGSPCCVEVSFIQPGHPYIYSHSESQ